MKDFDLEQFEGFTPGPWEWSQEEDTLSQNIYVHRAIDADKSAEVCSMAPNNYSYDTDYYDARLIAAAPQILAIAKSLMRQRDILKELTAKIIVNCTSMDEVLNEVDEALAKIREEQERE